MKRRLIGSSSPMETLPLHKTGVLNERKKRRRSWTINWHHCRIAVLASVTFIALQWLRGPSSSGETVQERSLPYYTPQPRDSGAKWEWPLIHIVNTRFMQEQGNLTALGNARLALFRIFCLPTMQQQTSQNFLWIIKTDPSLDSSILEEMVGYLQPYPNFFLVASNVNFRINEQFPGAWRDGAEVDDLAKSRVYTGNQSLLESAMSYYRKSDPYPILETRLDADDGLHVQFLEVVQTAAMDAFHNENPEKTPSWLYWCSRRHVEWHFAEKRMGNDPIWDRIISSGAFAGIQHSKLCITPGITVGFAPGISENEVPIYPHDKIIANIQNTPNDEACGLEQSSDCLQFVENFVFEAIRSRSPTSAGMLRVDIVPTEVARETRLYNAFLDMVSEKFGISETQLKWINQYLKDHLLEIAEENLKGQVCTLYIRPFNFPEAILWQFSHASIPCLNTLILAVYTWSFLQGKRQTAPSSYCR